MVFAVAVLAGACGASITSDVPSEAEELNAEAPTPGQPQQPGPPDSQAEIPPDQVDTLFQSPISGVRTARRQVIDSEETWRSAWEELVGNVAPLPPAPGVDFATQLALLVSMGERSSGGYTIEMGPIKHDASTLTVVVREVSPGAGCATTLALTSPALVVAVPQVAKTVVFEEESVTNDCG